MLCPAIDRQSSPESWNLFNLQKFYIVASIVRGMLAWKCAIINVTGLKELCCIKKGLTRPDGQPGFVTLIGRCELRRTVYTNICEDSLPNSFKQLKSSFFALEVPCMRVSFPHVRCQDPNLLIFETCVLLSKINSCTHFDRKTYM
jgi:hypothetical protein